MSQMDVLQVKRVLGQATLERELFEQRAAGALPAAQLKAEVTSLDTIELVRTNLVRFGGVTVVLFLVSLLTPIYRYNVRLGTFYQARADYAAIEQGHLCSEFSRDDPSADAHIRLRKRAHDASRICCILHEGSGGPPTKGVTTGGR